jgi:hypothetical protein
MIRVILESPYGNADPEIVKRNVTFARACVRDSLSRGEAPIASHLLYTQEGILLDNDPEERQLGIDAGLAWGSVAETTVVYLDLGLTAGMQYGIDHAVKMKRKISLRHLVMPISRAFEDELAQKILKSYGKKHERLLRRL